MYVKRGLGAESLARIFANLSRRDAATRRDPDSGAITRLPRPPETSGKRQVV